MIKEKILPRKFYKRDTVEVAKDLLGKIIVRKIDGKIISGIITEVEAYRSDDPASHSFRGKTIRNRAMFEEVGHSYIYFIYGNHFCLNIVSRDQNHTGGGVLIRALKPLEGIDMMCKNRKINNVSNLTNGPGKLTQALQINNDQYGIDLTKSNELYVTQGIKVNKTDIVSTPRIGISKAKDKHWRFLINL
jgi:DNA-3-methyladenine glycosylase